MAAQKLGKPPPRDATNGLLNCHSRAGVDSSENTADGAKRKDSEQALEALNAARHALLWLPYALRLALADPEFPVGELLARRPGDGGLYHKPEKILALLDACEVYAEHPHGSLSGDKAGSLAVIDKARKLIAEAGQ